LNLRAIDADHVAASIDETTRRADIETLWAAFGGGDEAARLHLETIDGETAEALPEPLRRRSGYLTHPVFHAHRSETEMLRYLRRLQSRDIALDRSMIPLGSCTMKLNAA